ncbi:hypothetical protein RRSWK_05639 [Rhodopirellula sp. SWK7]|nr:hypothetical protein RRSWK_05639 [Rhodopirellula sp. SWK7]
MKSGLRETRFLAYRSRDSSQFLCQDFIFNRSFHRGNRGQKRKLNEIVTRFSRRPNV